MLCDYLKSVRLVSNAMRRSFQVAPAKRPKTEHGSRVNLVVRDPNTVDLLTASIHSTALKLVVAKGSGGPRLT